MQHFGQQYATHASAAAGSLTTLAWLHLARVLEPERAFPRATIDGIQGTYPLEAYPVDVAKAHGRLSWCLHLQKLQLLKHLDKALGLPGPKRKASQKSNWLSDMYADLLLDADKPDLGVS